MLNRSLILVLMAAIFCDGQKNITSSTEECAYLCRTPTSYVMCHKKLLLTETECPPGYVCVDGIPQEQISLSITQRVSPLPMCVKQDKTKATNPLNRRTDASKLVASDEEKFSVSKSRLLKAKRIFANLRTVVENLKNKITKSKERAQFEKEVDESVTSSTKLIISDEPKLFNETTVSKEIKVSSSTPLKMKWTNLVKSPSSIEANETAELLRESLKETVKPENLKKSDKPPSTLKRVGIVDNMEGSLEKRVKQTNDKRGTKGKGHRLSKCKKGHSLEKNTLIPSDSAELKSSADLSVNVSTKLTVNSEESRKRDQVNRTNSSELEKVEKMKRANSSKEHQRQSEEIKRKKSPSSNEHNKARPNLPNEEIFLRPSEPQNKYLHKSKFIPKDFVRVEGSTEVENRSDQFDELKTINTRESPALPLQKRIINKLIESARAAEKSVRNNSPDPLNLKDLLDSAFKLISPDLSDAVKLTPIDSGEWQEPIYERDSPDSSKITPKGPIIDSGERGISKRLKALATPGKIVLNKLLHNLMPNENKRSLPQKKNFFEWFKSAEESGDSSRNEVSKAKELKQSVSSLFNRMIHLNVSEELDEGYDYGSQSEVKCNPRPQLPEKEVDESRATAEQRDGYWTNNNSLRFSLSQLVTKLPLETTEIRRIDDILSKLISTLEYLKKFLQNLQQKLRTFLNLWDLLN